MARELHRKLHCRMTVLSGINNRRTTIAPEITAHFFCSELKKETHYDIRDPKKEKILHVMMAFQRMFV